MEYVLEFGMRPDIEKIKSHISIQETLEQFGELINNDSKIISKCVDCSNQIITNIFQLKGRLKRMNCVLCTSCSIKRSWAGETRVKNAKFWNETRRQNQSLLMKKIGADPAVKKKHIESCAKAYLDPERKQKISEKSKNLWKDPEFRARQIAIKKKLWEDPEYRKNQLSFMTSKEFRLGQSQKMLEIWNREGYTKNQTEKHKVIWTDENFRKNQTEKQKQVWNREGYKKIQSNLQKEKWKDPEHRAFYEKMWKDPDYQSRLSEILIEKWKDPNYQEKNSLASKKKWENQDYKQRVISSLKITWQDPELRAKVSARSKKKWEDEDFQKRMGEARAKQSGKPSSIEVITESILKSIPIKYQTQAPVGPFLFDFFLPDLNIYIECQGEYWHSLPRSLSRDASKFSYLEKSNPNSRLLYLYEHEFLNPNIILSKITNFISGEIDIKQIDFEFSSVKINAVDHDNARKFLNAFHYAAFGRSHKNLYGAFLGDQLIAVSKFCTPIRQEVATSMNMSYQKVLELDRFCIHPAYQKKNFASWLLSRFTKQLFSDSLKIQCLVSFADSTYGHFGTIYKAANWKEIGTIRPDYYYVSKDGFILHKKTLYNRAIKMNMKEKDYADEHEYKKLFGREKIKFMFKRPENSAIV
jgi:very-short-patch-repair endonuclease